MEKAIICREEEIRDILDSFVGILHSLSRGSEFRRTMARKLSECGRFLAVYDEHDNKAAGFAAFYDNDTSGRVAYLSMLAVSKAHRSKGVGSYILHEVEDFTSKSGMNMLRLEVEKDNLNAISFYKRNDFRLYEEREKSYVLEKDLPVADSIDKKQAKEV